MNSKKLTHLIRNCPQGQECKQTWETLKPEEYRNDIKRCNECKKQVWEVSVYPIDPFLLERNSVIAILYDITDLKKMVDKRDKPMVQPRIPKFSSK
jgi:hypothetical protein